MLWVGIRRDGQNMSDIGLRGVVCVSRNFLSMCFTSSILETGVLFTEIRIESRRSVRHFGIREDGVDARHSLRSS